METADNAIYVLIFIYIYLVLKHIILNDVLNDVYIILKNSCIVLNNRV